MSLDLDLSRWHGGAPWPMATASFLAPFLPLVARREPRCLVLGLPNDQDSALLVDWSALAVSSATLNRPVDDLMLWQALHDALRQPGMVLIVPDAVPPLIGGAASAAQLPADMVAALGAPAVVDSPAEIRRWVRGEAG
jgi:hypothetical protein